MRRLFVLAALLFAMPSHAVEFDWVEIGDPGNACETQSQGCFGSVGSVYGISKHEVTTAQYAEFLNAVADTDTYGLYDNTWGGFPDYGGITRSGSSGSFTYNVIAGREDMPVNFVSFYDALRFANWLHNGQPTGAQDGTTTEDGAYTMIEEDYDSGQVITRNPGATIFLTSEDEWYKAAYYDALSTSYFDYPAGANAQTECVVPSSDTGNSANCDHILEDLTDVGAYLLSGSPYGTFDQGGNVWEWNEAIIGSYRTMRGGRFNYGPDELAASYRRDKNPTSESRNIGFRVARIPECDDGVDNDGDGFTDYPDDPGCADADDLSENSPLLVCDDGDDNDGDTLIDYPNDPGCWHPASNIENPQCQDGWNNDPHQDGWIDFDGGASAGVPPEWQTAPDPQCVGMPWKNWEARRGGSCGLGAELALPLPPLMWFWRRRRQVAETSLQ